MRLTYPIPDPEEPATESDQTIKPLRRSRALAKPAPLRFVK